jgi:Nuclease-related domain
VTPFLPLRWAMVNLAPELKGIWEGASLDPLITGLVLGAALTVAVALGVLAWRRRPGHLERVFREIAHEALEHAVIPDGLGGLIHLDWVLLTRNGLIVIEVKPFEGTIFCGEQLERWSWMQDGRRTEFDNPMARLRERIASVRTLVPDVPVSGCVLFTGRVDFPYGQADSVLTLAQLHARYAEEDTDHTRPGASHAGQAFYEAWQQIRRATRDASDGDAAEA